MFTTDSVIGGSRTPTFVQYILIQINMKLNKNWMYLPLLHKCKVFMKHRYPGNLVPPQGLFCYWSVSHAFLISVQVWLHFKYCTLNVSRGNTNKHMIHLSESMPQTFQSGGTTIHSYPYMPPCYVHGHLHTLYSRSKHKLVWSDDTIM